MATSGKNLSQYDLNGLPDGSDFVVSVVVSEWNDEITGNLLEGACEALINCGVKQENLIVSRVPGSFELPMGAQMLLESNSDIDAVICLGSVIRGETSHFDYVCSSTSQGIMDVGLKYNKPVIFGVLTDDNIQQSKDRSGGKHGNKGVEAAITALKMIQLGKGLK